MADSTLRKSRTERNRNPLRRFFLAVLVFQIGFSTPILQGRSNTALATDVQGEYDAVCGGMDTNNPEKMAAKPDCDSVQSALQARRVLIVLAIIHATMAGLCFWFATWEWAGSGALCTTISIVASGVKGFLESQTSIQIENASVKTRESIRNYSSLAVGAFQVALKSNAGFLKTVGLDKLASKFVGDGKAANKASCLLSAGVQLFHWGMALWGVMDANNIMRFKMKDAKNAIEAYRMGNRVRGDFAPPSLPADENAPPRNVSGSPEFGRGDSCASAGGNDYLACVAKGDPKLGAAFSALTADKNLNDLIGKLSGGKTLGDIVKSFGDRDPTGSAVANHVAGAFGLPSSVGAEFGKHMENFAEELRKEIGGAGGVYTSKGKSTPASSGSGDPDFSKMMEGLMKQMAPKGEEPTAESAKENPTDAVFRKLDLLPAEKIESSNISLFVRVGYRYRKKTPSILTGVEPASAPAPEKFRR